MDGKIYRQGDIIYREGEHGDLLYRVLEGAARVVIDKDRETEKTLTELTAGQFFGELSAIGGYPRSATVVAAADGTRLAELTVEDMEGYFKEDPDAVLELLKYFGSRIHELSDDYEEARKALSALKTAGDKPCAEGFLQKIRRFANCYFGSGSGKEILSAEARQAAAKKDVKGSEDKTRSYPSGTVLYREGEPGHCMYRVHWGQVGIYSGYGTDKQLKLTDVTVDQFFGLMGMLEDQNRSATAVILENDTTLEPIRLEDIRNMLAKNPNTVWMIFEYTALRLRRLTDSYAEVCRQICELQKA